MGMSLGIQTANFNYSDPSDHGLEPVAELELENEAYQFNIVAVWKDRDGVLWAAHDTGCSCPSPFEDHTFPTDFSIVRSEQDVRELIHGGAYVPLASIPGVQEFLLAVWTAL